MNTPTVYVICDNNCKYESLTKEQILTAITQAIESGTVGDINTGFVTTIKTITGAPLRFFVGSQAEYAELSTEDRENLFAIITNDTEKESIEKVLKDLDKRLTSWEQAFEVPPSCIMRNKNEEMHNGAKGGIMVYAPTEGLFVVPTWKATGHNICFGLVYWDGSTSTSTAVSRAYTVDGVKYRYLVNIEPTGVTVTANGGTYTEGIAKVRQINQTTGEISDLTISDTDIEVRYITDYYYHYVE